MSSAARDVTRRTVLRAASTAAACLAGEAALGPLASASAAAATRDASRLFGELDERIEAGMARYAIPGASVGVLYQGTEYVKGYGVTDVDNPVPVDGDTVFRIASTTKTFTGTAVMRLVEAGRLALDAPVRRYLPGFETAEPAVARRVTVRQLLNHTAGWVGNRDADTSTDDAALARYVAEVAQLPQLTTPGRVFSYNNAALAVAGRLIETVTGMPYERALHGLVLRPLRLEHSGFFAADVAGATVATSHAVDDGRAVTTSTFFEYPRARNPIGGLMSSARDQLRHARFHLGDGRVPGGGRRLLLPASLRGMQSPPGPGGTLLVELDGMGVTWMLRPSAQGVRIVQHGGNTAGQHSGFLMVPDREFALTLLTNSNGGAELVSELFSDDWALRRFAGIGNLPAQPQRLPAEALACYEGTYAQLSATEDGELVTGRLEVTAAAGQLIATVWGTEVARAAFYRPDYVVLLTPDGEVQAHRRADFVRGAGGRVDWLRIDGRLWRHESG
ncbi:MAG: beta-lactamase family protein [Dactylosporangium sp.]|nr:beta-lactamase family protein [Dactylosporangium sp.]